MKILKEKTWQHETTGLDGNANLFDVNIFDYKWERTHKSAKVHDPFMVKNTNFLSIQLLSITRNMNLLPGNLAIVSGVFIP